VINLLRGLRVCLGCGDTKRQVDFYTGRHTCKACEIAKRVQHYAANKQRVNEYSSAWKARNRGRRAETLRREYEATDPIVLMLRTAKSRAKKRGVPFQLTPADIEVPAVCPILGIPIQRSRELLAPGSPSLDRIIPTLGYVPGNVAVISQRANTIKNSGTAAEHERIAEWMRAKGAT